MPLTLMVVANFAPTENEWQPGSCMTTLTGTIVGLATGRAPAKPAPTVNRAAIARTNEIFFMTVAPFLRVGARLAAAGSTEVGGAADAPWVVRRRISGTRTES